MIILITSGSTVHFPGLWVSELLPQGSFLLTILAEIVNEVWTVCQALGQAPGKCQIVKSQLLNYQALGLYDTQERK